MMPRDLEEALSALTLALEAKSPHMKQSLQQIHTTLKQYPECVTILSEEQIGTIVAGLKQQTQVNFAVASSKGTGTRALNARLKNISVNDI